MIGDFAVWLAGQPAPVRLAVFAALFYIALIAIRWLEGLK